MDWKLDEMVVVQRPKMAAIPYHVYGKKNLQNHSLTPSSPIPTSKKNPKKTKNLDAASCYEKLGMGDLLSLFKRWSWVDIWPF